MPEGTGLHAWLEDKLAMKAVSAMLTDSDLSIPLRVRHFNDLAREKQGASRQA